MTPEFIIEMGFLAVVILAFMVACTIIAIRMEEKELAELKALEEKNAEIRRTPIFGEAQND